MRRQHPSTSYFWCISLNHGQQTTSFSSVGRGRGSGSMSSTSTLTSSSSSNPLNQLFTSSQNIPQAINAAPSTGVKTKVYSLANFAARAQVVPLAGKGKGVVPDQLQEEQHPNSPPVVESKNSELGLLKGLPTGGSGEVLTVDAARSLLRKHSPTTETSYQQVVSPQLLSPSSQAFRLSGQSLLKTLAKRSTRNMESTSTQAQESSEKVQSDRKVRSNITDPQNSIKTVDIGDLCEHIELVRSLIAAIHERKVIHWERLPRTIQDLPAFHNRIALSNYMRASSQGSDSEQQSIEPTKDQISSKKAMPPILCTGNTGCGKSIIAPLLMLDLHWRGVVIGLSRYLSTLMTVYHSTAATERGHQEDKDLNSTDINTTIVPSVVREDKENYAIVPEAFVPYFDPQEPIETFLDNFPQRSRLRVYVSQPTRLAAKSLAEFLNQCLGGASSFRDDVQSTFNQVKDNQSTAHPKTYTTFQSQLPMGFRVGYATALDKTVFEDSCEIVFATVGYLLNRLAASSTLNLNNQSEYNVLTRQTTQNTIAKSDNGAQMVDASSMHPTSSKVSTFVVPHWQQHDLKLPFTIVLDEAHRRDLQSDLLMAWAREWHTLGTQAPSTSLPSKRKLIIMSASMDPAMYQHYFIAITPPPAEVSSVDANQTTKRIAFDMSADEQMRSSLEASRAADPFPQEYRGADQIAESLLKKTDDLHQTTLGSSLNARIKSYKREIYYCDDIMNILRVIQFNKRQLRESRKGSDEKAKTKNSRWRDEEEVERNDDQRLIGMQKKYQLATTILARASPTSLEELYTASHYENQATGISLYDIAAKVAVQCVSVNQHTLVFVPGYEELLRFVMSVAKHSNVPLGNVNISQKEDSFSSETDGKSGGEGEDSVAPALSFLQNGSNVLVDVVALHASAIGEASAQLRASKAKAKIIVATNVAESSITIPNVALVLNTGLERVSSSIGGNIRLVTRMGSKSSFIQREGRTGRTCDGVVLHLLPKSTYDKVPNFSMSHWQESGETVPLLLTAKLLFPPTIHSVSDRQLPSTSTAHPEAEAVYCPYTPRFSLSSLCSKLPTLISNPNILLPSAGYLCDAGILSESTHGSLKPQPTPLSSELNTKTSATDMLAWSLLDATSLTFKGRFVAALPLATPLALFVYHGFMFGCLDASLITACAMESNVTAIGPGLLQNISLDVYERGMSERFRLSGDNSNDVWLNFSIMDNWYNTQLSNKPGFASSLMVRLKALLRADELVAMCAAKLLEILAPMRAANNDKRSRHTLRRLTLLRKYALANTLLRSSRQTSYTPMIAPLPKCAAPEDGLGIDLRARLRASFVNAYYRNIVVGQTHDPASPITTSATMNITAIPPTPPSITLGNNSSPAFIALKLLAGSRNLSTKFFSNVTQQELEGAINRIFAKSKTISFESVRLLPSRSSLMVKISENVNQENEDDKMEADDDDEVDGATGRKTIVPAVVTNSDLESNREYLLDPKPLKRLSPLNTAREEESSLNSDLEYRIKAAPFSLWLIHSLPAPLRDVRMPLNKLQKSEDTSSIDETLGDDDNDDFLAAQDFTIDFAANSSATGVDQKVPINFSGSLRFDSQSGIATHFQLKQDATELVSSDIDIQVRDESASIDLLRASALGYKEWCPSTVVFEEAGKIIEEARQRKRQTNGEGETSIDHDTPAELELAAAAKPWHSIERHQNFSQSDKISNIFLRVGKVFLPNVINWVAHVSPKFVYESVSRHRDVSTSLRQNQLAARLVMEKNDSPDSETPQKEVSPTDSATSTTKSSPLQKTSHQHKSLDIIDRITCPICCESIPVAARALHITRPSHLRNLYRLVHSGTPSASLYRVLSTSTAGPAKTTIAFAAEALKLPPTISEGSAIEANDDPTAHLTSQQKRFVVEALTAQSASDGKRSPKDKSNQNGSRLRDLIQPQDADCPIPASINATSLNSLLTVSAGPSYRNSSKSTASAIAFATSLSIRASASIAAVGTWVIDPTNRSEAYVLLQAAILQEATSDRPLRPVMLLFDDQHTKIFGFCVVGLYTISFGSNPLKPSAIQQLLEVKHGARRAASLFEAAENEMMPSNQGVNASPAPSGTLAPLAIGGAAIARLQEVLQRGLSPLELEVDRNNAGLGHGTIKSTNHGPVSVERHWCPLDFPCQSRHCEHMRLQQLREQKEATSTTATKTVGWSPSNPIEVAVSSAILALLHEAQLISHHKQQLTHFTQRLIHNLSMAAKQIGIVGKTRVVEVEIETNVTNHQKDSASSTMLEEVEVEIGSGVRLLEGFIKLRGAESLEQVLTYCGCIFTTTYLDGLFIVPPVLPTAIPSPSLIRRIANGDHLSE